MAPVWRRWTTCSIPFSTTGNPLSIPSSGTGCGVRVASGHSRLPIASRSERSCDTRKTTAAREICRAELETAALLFRDERFTLEYEKNAASRQRAPDFTVTFKTHTPFNVEVRRIRSAELFDRDTEARTGKLMAVLCDKVGQMPPGSINLLWLVAGSEITEDDLTRAATTLRQLAERKVEQFFTRRGFESAAGFLRYNRRLSGIVLRQSGAPFVWLNSLAGHKAPPEIVTAIKRLEIG